MNKAGLDELVKTHGSILILKVEGKEKMFSPAET